MMIMQKTIMDCCAGEATTFGGAMMISCFI